MRIKNLIIGFCLITGVISCSKNEDQTVPPITSGDIIGAVNLYDEGTTQIGNSGLTVKLEGTNFSSTTNAEGNFRLTNVPFGTYNVVYEKEGFGTYKKFDLEHSSTGSSTIIPETPSLGQVSSTEITELTAETSADGIVISIRTNPSANNGNNRYVRYFLSSNENVSNQDYTSYSQGLIVRITPYDINLTKEELLSQGFSSGQTVYVKVYGDSFWSNEYDDLVLQRRIFPNLNMNAVSSVAFQVP